MDKSSESKIEQDYKLISPLLDRLVIEAEDCIKAMLSKSEIKIHAILHRIKTVESCKEKLCRKLDDSGKVAPIFMLTDLVGLRIVCLFLSDIKEIENMIGKSFRVMHKDDKTNSSDSNTFGYHGTHFIVKLKEEYSGPRYDHIKDMAFEIQVRTITMDAWAAASHYLDYKSGKGVPSELKKDFYALSGLFYVVDTHFELFFNESQKSKKNTFDSSFETLIGSELNEDTLILYLRKKFPDKSLNSNQVAELTIELIDSGYKTIKSIDDDVQRGMANFKFPKRKKYNVPHLGYHNFDGNSTSIVRKAIASVNNEFKKIVEEKDVLNTFIYDDKNLSQFENEQINNFYDALFGDKN